LSILLKLNPPEIQPLGVEIEGIQVKFSRPLLLFSRATVSLVLKKDHHSTDSNKTSGEKVGR
jgi:hypothetical protein